MIVQPWERALYNLNGASVALTTAVSADLSDLAIIRPDHADGTRIVAARLTRMIEALQTARAEVLGHADEGI